MAEGSVDIEVQVSPKEAWAVVGDFGGIGEILPGLESFRLEGDDRIIGMMGLEIRERLVARDEEAMSITYSIVEGVPVEKHQATISVAGSGDTAKVTWAYDVEPESLLPIFAGVA
jgi:carbon monoxide dehydrogenase subunit G